MTAGFELAGYDVWGLLGEGGMSEVWLAKHRALATPVIVKTLRAALRRLHDSAGTRILDEARLMARVASPRIVRALDAGSLAITSGGTTPYLVQEYIDGLDLAELDRRRRAAVGVGLPLWFVCHAMRETCSALRSAHQAGVIHRDLKPSNIFGSHDTGIRLGDFGIAVGLSDGAVKESAGTLKFMAPEQFGSGEVGRFTDVWGAGATACDLRYGRGPFDSAGEIVDPGRGPRLPPPQTPAEAYFQQILRCMLAKDLRERPEDLSGPLTHFAMLAKALTPPTLRASRVGPRAIVVGPVKITFTDGDIADATADAIVSSANFEMKMRSGVGGSLRERGGDEIEAEAMAEGERPLGSCIRTGPGRLAARHVFHAVGAWNEVSCLGRAFARALLLCDENGCESVAVPALGTGVAKVGLEMCATAMMTTLRWHALLGTVRLREMTVVLDCDAKRRLFQDIAEEVLHVSEAGALTALDLGLPVEDGVLASPEGVTFFDPRGGTGDAR